MSLRLTGMLLHGALLAVPWLFAMEPIAGVAALAWVLCSVESDTDTSEEVPPGEAHRALGLLLTLMAALATARPIGMEAFALGLLGLGGGLVLRRAAIRALGPAFTARIVVGDRVRTGPYRWLDHPSELGLLVATLGFVTLCSSVWGLVAWVVAVMVPALARCRAEDQAWAASPSGALR